MPANPLIDGPDHLAGSVFFLPLTISGSKYFFSNFIFFQYVSVIPALNVPVSTIGTECSKKVFFSNNNCEGFGSGSAPTNPGRLQPHLIFRRKAESLQLLRLHLLLQRSHDRRPSVGSGTRKTLTPGCSYPLDRSHRRYPRRPARAS